MQLVRFLSVVLTALILGPAFAHVLEMPVKMAMAASDYLVVQQIYVTFGPVGSVIEPGAILSAIVLTVLLRGRRAFLPALIGALCLITALLAWFAIVSPVNAHWMAATPQIVPEGFEGLRARWEWGHVIHAALLFAALVALVVAVLAEIPARGAAVDVRHAPQERAA